MQILNNEDDDTVPSLSESCYAFGRAEMEGLAHLPRGQANNESGHGFAVGAPF